MAPGTSGGPSELPARALTATIWLDLQARALIAAEAVARPRRETGGALFGFGSGNDLVVACAYGPGPRAKHRRTTFEPHPSTTQALIDAVFAECGARYRYVGSWHSHPGGVARPSSTDIRTTESVAGDHEVALPEPVVLIQSTGRGHAGGRIAAGELRGWRWSADHEWLLPCELRPLELAEPYCPVVEVPGGRRRTQAVMAPRPR